MGKKNFTMVELITVITIMAVLMTMLINISKPDPTKKDITSIGNTISLYHAKSMTLQEGEVYSFDLNNSLIVKDNAGQIIENIKLSESVKYLDAATPGDFTINHRGECSTSKIEFTIGKYEGKINKFTGRFSYYH